MSWWSTGRGNQTPKITAEQFLQRHAPQQQLDDASIQRGLQVSTQAVDAFESISSLEGKLEALQQLDGSSRKALLAALRPSERDQVLGGSSMNASFHNTGPEYEVNWSQIDASDTAYNPKNAHAMAVASKRVYESPEVVRAEWEAQGYEVKFFDNKGTQAFLAIKDDHAMLAFRGTQPDQLEDLVTDAKLCPKEGYRGQVHEGFDKGLDAVWGDLSEALQEAGVGPDKPLMVTGHSLGAALGTLASVRMEQELGITPTGLYTFGSPRVGNSEFAEAFQDSALGQRTWRFRNNNDGVTRVPPHGNLLEYTHVGTEIYFDNEGTAHADLSEEAVTKDRRGAFTPVTEYFLKMHNRDHEIENLWDHGMSGYVKHVFVNGDFHADPSQDPKI